MISRNNLRIIFSIISLSTLFACGGGSSPDTGLPSPPQQTSQSHKVTVIDGYLSGATVWLDLNDNGSRDADEPTLTTEKNGIGTFDLDSDVDTTKYRVMAHAHAGVTFDESLNQFVESDFFLSSIKGGTIITPLTTLVYFKSIELDSEEEAKLLVSSLFDLSSQGIFEDFIAAGDKEQESLAADIVRLSLMPETESEFSSIVADSGVLFSNLSEYRSFSVRGEDRIHVIRDINGGLSGDTDIDGIADTDDQDMDGDGTLNEADDFPYNSKEWEDLDNDGIGNNSDTDIDGDGILNDEDDNPLLAEFNTIKNPGEIKISELTAGYISQNQWQYFTVESPEDVMLNFSLSNLSDDVDLYVEQGESPTKFNYQCRSNLSNIESEKCVVRAKEISTYHIGVFARQNSTFELTVESEAIVYQKVMLLLHGLASSPETWDAMVNDDSFFNGSCQNLTIDNDTLTEVENNNDGISCFNLEFGSYDRDTKYSATGLDDKVCNSVLGCNGDYTTFEGLGYEVDDAISRIVELLGTDIEVFIFGHSRGGLAARYFLQNSLLTNISLVKGFATTGTPHQGSPLGRFYQYMHDNCVPKSTYRQDGSKCEDNWEMIEMLQGTREFLGFNYSKEYNMDLQAPSVDFLSPESISINSLNETLQSLNGLTMGQLTYQGTSFGILSPEYDLYDYGVWFSGDHPHPDTLSYVQNGQTRSSLIGDGIVPAESQKLNLLLEKEGLFITAQKSLSTSNILHIEETSQVTDIYWLFERLYQSLGWRS